MGTIGHNHLLCAAQKSFGLAEAKGAGNAGLVEAGIRLLCMAWVEFPLNVPLAGRIESLSRQSPIVSRLLLPPALKLAGRIVRLGQGADDETANRLFAGGPSCRA